LVVLTGIILAALRSGRRGTAGERRGDDLVEAPHALRDVADRCN
jgi:hypothetical protein